MGQVPVLGGSRGEAWAGPWEGPKEGCPHPSSRCLGDHHGGGWDVAASPLPPHSFGAGCQGFHCVTHILPIQGSSCSLTQLMADSIQVKWSTGETHVDYLVPNEATLVFLGRQ